jgi:hypothetical protein
VNVLEEWISKVCDELGITQPLDRDVVLDLARDVAHNVARPAAPLTTFLLGLAAGAAGDPAAVRTMASRVTALAESWPAEARDH